MFETKKQKSESEYFGKVNVSQEKINKFDKEVDEIKDISGGASAKLMADVFFDEALETAKNIEVWLNSQNNGMAQNIAMIALMMTADRLNETKSDSYKVMINQTVATIMRLKIADEEQFVKMLFGGVLGGILDGRK